MKLSWIDEFASDWVLSGKSPITADAYKKNLLLLFKYCAEPQVFEVDNINGVFYHFVKKA